MPRDPVVALLETGVPEVDIAGGRIVAVGDIQGLLRSLSQRAGRNRYPSFRESSLGAMFGYQPRLQNAGLDLSGGRLSLLPSNSRPCADQGDCSDGALRRGKARDARDRSSSISSGDTSLPSSIVETDILRVFGFRRTENLRRMPDPVFPESAFRD